jgi:transcriptional regulator with XRE-family HTH domain
MAPTTRGEFNRAFGMAMRAEREARGLSLEELAAVLKANRTPAEQDEYLRLVVAIGTVVTSMRLEQGLTEDELADRSRVPAEFVRNLEGSKDLNPDGYYLYCVALGLESTFREVWQRAEVLLRSPEGELPEGGSDGDGEEVEEEP